MQILEAHIYKYTTLQIIIAGGDSYINITLLWYDFFQSKKVFLLRGGYRRIRKSLRKRGWVEQNYYKNSFKSTNDGGTLGLKKGVETSHLNGCGIGGDSDGDSDADVNDGGDVSEEEHSDEEEYCMLVR